MQRYAQLMAESMLASGRRAGVATALLHSAWRFLRGYILRLGFLDGWRGLLFALVEAQYVRDKYVKLFLLGTGLDS